MTTLSPEGEARAAATERFIAEWRDPDSWVRREARERLAGGLWSGPVIERAFDVVFSDRADETPRVHVENWFEQSREFARRALVILPGNIIGPALCAAYAAAVTGGSAILKAASTERAIAEIVARQFIAIGEPLAGSIEARYWPGGDIAAEADAIADVGAVIAFGTDATIEAVRARVPAEKHFIGYGTRYSLGLVTAGKDLVMAADAAAVDVCLFDQAGCMSPQTIYVVGDASRALRFASALDGALRKTSLQLPRVKPTRDEAAAANDVVRRSYIAAIDANSHGLSPVLAGPDNGGCPDYLIVVEPQGEPRTHGFGRIVTVMPLELGRPPVITKYYERLGVTSVDGDTFEIDLHRALRGNEDRRNPWWVELGHMQDAGALPSAFDFVRQNGDAV
ncbi:MAG TPA: acyl-CoA reductase [Candidatus Eremiobacteraceae bacterium]